MSEFEREDRYAVIKYKKLTGQQWTLVPTMLERFNSARVDCVVIEKDWPEYNFVWLMLEHRMAGFPVPDFNAVKCAADVQAAQSELTALREELRQLTIRMGGQSALIDSLNAQTEKQKSKYVSLVQRNSRLVGQRNTTRQRLTAAEQRNAELEVLLMNTAEVLRYGNGYGWEDAQADIIDAALEQRK